MNTTKDANYEMVADEVVVFRFTYTGVLDRANKPHTTVKFTRLKNSSTLMNKQKYLILLFDGN